MKSLRLFFFCVLALVLPVNSVLAQMPAYAKIASAHTEHAAHQHDASAPHLSQTPSSEQLHIHLGLFGQQSVHVHEPMPVTTTDCAKACQTSLNSILLDPLFAIPLFSAILVDAAPATLCSVTLAPLEDPPKLRA
ncbi:hypothetical protein HQN60_10585 [Deefgea piscis]|uniref:Uncharacterized protein n=1 Tax=Deefgea piscis TaxID=2739061 RepID=A0A6M8SSQ3_9NEIS|nr:hypothetical protein [Deefgea piscis]QKJ67108.1 hypothetical protein HQN60_10585 [Deefgea piscis]